MGAGPAQLTLTALSAMLAAALLVPATARAAQVDPPSGGSGSPGGYTASVSVRFTGEAAPGGGSTRTMQIPATCWWAPASSVYQDPKASLAWYDEVTGGLQTRGVIGEYGPRRIWADAAKSGTSSSWYRATCRDAKDLSRYDAGSNEDVDSIDGIAAPFVTYYYRAFPAGAAVPPPLVDPIELARAAREVMVIPAPEVDRNPKIASAGAPTLVGLPTWFWVTDPDAVGGTTGARDITATVGAVFATVTATTGGLHLNSPAGGANCPPARALVKYADGVPDASACTVEFARASVGYRAGYPVAASTDWVATWVGSGGTGGDLDPLARDFTANVPVAEVQNIVTR